ncbi:hypothetical protein V2J09_016426 [Rumex salicifolius]
MGNEPDHDSLAHHPGVAVDCFASNAPFTHPLPATAYAPAAAAIRFPADPMIGDDSLIVKRKRGRPPKIGGKAKAVAVPVAKKSKEEEDVCFICFDGGNLVLCDRRDCPKAYHPACVKRDESFFKRRVRWNCGWHLCNICQRNAIFMCYTCPYSLCKTCVKQADISCVRGSKGFCKMCITTISLIENIKPGIQEVGLVDFDDTTSWEYLFKVYWVYLKEKESLTLDELNGATNPWKGLTLNHVNNCSESSQNNFVNRTVELSSTAGPLEIQNNQVDTNVSKRRKIRKQPLLQNNSWERIHADKLLEGVEEWASQELLEFVAHVKNGDKSKLTHFDVQALLLEYIRKNKLRDPHRKCQIICDKRLGILFGKARVGHFEMLKLLEYHFKDGSCASIVVRAAAIDSSDNQMKVEESSEEVYNIMSERKRQARKKVDGTEIEINLDNFAAIDVHNMCLIYLRRTLMESLMEDATKFHDNVVGSIVRIRISGNDLKQEMYRLVRVIGTGMAAEPYKIGDKSVDIILKILNLDKIEDVRIDAISNQDFSEDECRRLRQSIKCGLVERLTVGGVHDKAVALQEVRIRDVLETEVLKLNHLRDRAKKLDLLKSPEERQRRMRKVPEVHADPRMDPLYQSDEDSEQSDTKQDGNTTPVHCNYISRSIKPFASRRGDMPYSTRAKFLQSSTADLEECMENASVRPILSREEDVAPLESSQSSLELETDAARILEELKNQVDPCRISNKHEAKTLENHPQHAFDASVTSSSRLALSPENFELDKIWHYRDPSGKVQGPFCNLQLRKWNSSGYFPVDLSVWRIEDSQDKSILLADVLSNHSGKEHQKHSDYSESHEARSLSDCKNLERGGKMNIDINAICTSGNPNDGLNTDFTDEARYSDDKKQPIAGCSGLGSGLDSVSQVSPEDVSKLSSASRNTECATMNQTHKLEYYDLPSPTPKDDNEDSNSLAVEPVQQFSAPNVSSHKSSSSPRLSSGELDPVQPISAIKPEIDHADIEKQAQGNKLDNELKEHSQQVTSIDLVPKRGSDLKPTSGQTNFSNLASQIPDLNNAEREVQVTEAKDSVTSYLPGQDPCTSWNDLSNGIEVSVPVSSTNQSSKGIKDPTVEHCLTSNATCQDIGNNWSTVTSLVSETIQWIGCPVQPKSCLGDHPTTTSGSCHFTNFLSAHPDSNTSSWGDGPIELSTLGDESVSDLLTEVEALESLHGMPSPNQHMDFGDDSIDSPSNDCFSRFVRLSQQPLEHGKQDAWSTTCDIEFHSQPTITEPAVKLDFVASSQQDLLSLTSMSLQCPPLTALNLQSSGILRPREVKPLCLPMHSLDTVSNSLNHESAHKDHNPELPLPTRRLHSSASPERKCDANPSHASENNHKLASITLSPIDGGMNLDNDPKSQVQPIHDADVILLQPVPLPPSLGSKSHSSPAEEGETEATLELLVKVPAAKSVEEEGEVKLLPLSHTRTTPPFSSPPETRRAAKPGHPYGRSSLGQGNRVSQQQRYHGGGGGRHSSAQKDRNNLHSPGFPKGSSRPVWNRQFGGSRPVMPPPQPPSQHRGHQRVCKFYESGYCKKGASCNYLHP